MAEKIPEGRQNGRSGNGSHGYHVQVQPQSEEPARAPPDRERLPDQAGHRIPPGPLGREGRYWSEAQLRGRPFIAGERERDREPERDRRSERDLQIGGAGYPRDREENDFYDERTPYDRMPAEFEHARAGFRDFGVPSETSGRLVKEPYTDRDFPNRDDHYAGHSGSSYRPDEMANMTSATQGFRGQFRSPEEEYERTHYRGRVEERRSRIWEREPATASEIMTVNPRAVRRDANLREVALIMRDENCGVVPVVDAGNRLLGLITDRDIVMRTVDTSRPWQELRADEVMSDDIHCVTPDEPVHSIIELMGRRQVRRVPVIDRNDRLLGMIAMSDVANRAEKDEELQHALDRISKRRSFWHRLWS